jgi:hypothetical protein
MRTWFRELSREFTGRSPVEQIDLLKKVGAFSALGALLIFASSFLFAHPGTDGAEKYTMQAVISDPDGFTHVRSMPSREGQIVATVRDGEVFSTYVQPSNWWHVRTRDNRYGFMHVTRIKPR